MDNHDITVIQVNKNLELHLGYVGGTTTGFDEADPIYTADKPFIALKSEIPTKTSDLQNDSGFISNIPQNLVTEQELDNKGYLTSFTQSDPVYSKDKPNLALKSELFSKSYNDLTDKPSIPSIDGLASEKYVDEKVSTVKVPSKTSELTNDSGFITANDIPSVEVTETDPIYTADKPNLALKSELFSKSYNDLTDKPDLYTPVSDGDGSKFLADDGTYKTVQTDVEVDLSNYVTQGNINFNTTDANGNLTNKFSQQAGYTQIGLYKTVLIDLYGNYLKWYQQKNQSYPLFGVDFSSATEFKLPENTTINGNKINANGNSNSNSNIIRDLTFEDEKIAENNVFSADFNGSAVQRYSTSNAISDGIVNFNLIYSDYQSNTCPTIQVMIPYTANLTTFLLPTEIQQINIPQQIDFNPDYMYNFAVFVFRRIGNNFYINYSYSY